MAKRMMYLRNGMISVELTPVPDNVVVNTIDQGVLDVNTKQRTCTLTAVAPLLNYDGTVMSDAAFRLVIDRHNDALRVHHPLVVIERALDHHRVQRKVFKLMNTPWHAVQMLRTMGVVDDKLDALNALIEATTNDDVITYVRSKRAIDNLLGFEGVPRIGKVIVASGELHAYPAVFKGQGVLLLTPDGGMPVFDDEDEAVWAYATVDPQLGVEQELDDATVVGDCALQLCPDTRTYRPAARYENLDHLMSTGGVITWRRVYDQWCVVNPVLFESTHRRVLAACGSTALATAELVCTDGSLDWAVDALRAQLRQMNRGDDDGA